MATLDSNGQIIPDENSQPYTPVATSPQAYNTYVANMGNLLSYITAQSSPTTAGSGANALALNTQGLQAAQAGLATPGNSNNPNNNPLNGLYAFMPGSALAETEHTMGNLYQPAILSQQNQAQGMAQTATSMQATVSAQEQAQIDAYNAAKPNWVLSPQTNADGEWYYYNTNTPAGQPPQTYIAGQIPPGVGGSPGGSPSSGTTNTLASMNNAYGIKVSPATSTLFESLGATPGISATDGGNFWSFPDSTTGDKAARTLLTSPIYANDSVDQALRQWSNYTGTGQYPGYNGSILAGTGVDPNATIKSLTSAQLDVVLGKMKEAENVGGANNQTAGTTANPFQTSGLTLDQFNKLQSTAPSYISQSLGYANATGDVYMPPITAGDPYGLAKAKWATDHNVPVLKADQLSDVTQINTALENLQNVATAFKEIAPDNFISKALSGTGNLGLNILDTPTGQKIAAYNDTLLPAALSALKTIVGNARLAQYAGDVSESALPRVPETVIPFASALTADSLQTGTQKIDVIIGNLNNALKTILPNSQGAPLSAGTNTTQNATTGVTSSGMKYTLTQ